MHWLEWELRDQSPAAETYLTDRSAFWCAVAQ
jgi:hypothetical protein